MVCAIWSLGTVTLTGLELVDHHSLKYIRLVVDIGVNEIYGRTSAETASWEVSGPSVQAAFLARIKAGVRANL